MDRALYYANLSEIYDKYGREPKMMSVREAARYTGFDHRTLLADKNLPIRYAGRKAVVAKTALASWLSRGC